MNSEKVSVVSIEYIGEHDVMDISVEDDHSFIVNDIVAHNCLSCAPLDGKVFPLDKGARPPLHANCRCTTTPVTKSFRELGIDIDDIPADTRSSMDGQVAADITYNQWLKKQPLSVQEMALGKTRAQLFRNGGLSIEQFTNRNRATITLDELKKLESDAFEKAHL